MLHCGFDLTGYVPFVRFPQQRNLAAMVEAMLDYAVQLSSPIRLALVIPESGRQSCLKIDLFYGDGVVELQKLGEQKISSIAGEAGEIFKRLAG